MNTVEAFITLGERIHHALSSDSSPFAFELSSAIKNAEKVNPWFTPQNIRRALFEISQMLRNIDADHIISHYKTSQEHPKTVAVIMAGNIPLVGFQDFAHVLISGHRALCRLSSDDAVLLPVISEMLCDIDCRFRQMIRFTHDSPSGFDAAIATGSNNTARYFEYYYSSFPHIIRKNRNSLAVITGDESSADMEGLSHDIFSYFGFGCRNVSALRIPENFDMQRFDTASEPYGKLIAHQKYQNNYRYYRALFETSKTPYRDCGFFLLKESDAISGPPAVVYFSYYKHVDEVKHEIELMKHEIQCVVSKCPEIEGAVTFGQSQSPGFLDFADGVDSLEFLSGL
jgi:hypothetical protein